jgi:4'-phosphopantetheinyl transferase
MQLTEEMLPNGKLSGGGRWPWTESLAQPGHPVDICYMSLDYPIVAIPDLIATLSDDEKQRAARFHFCRDRRRFIAARGTLRMILGHFLDTDPRSVQLGLGPHGKPNVVQPPSYARLEFNLSHSDGAALFAFAWNRRVGIDLEYIRPITEIGHLVERAFSSRERAGWYALPPSERLLAFFLCWTRKEAYIKATGAGLTQRLNEFDVSLAPGDQAKLLWVADDPQEPEHWSMKDLPMFPGYAACLAVEDEDPTLEVILV